MIILGRLLAFTICLGPAPSIAFAQAKIEHVVLVSVDGLHATDLARYTAGHPNSTLAALAAHGLTFSNAMTTIPSDSFPGLLALVTGGDPRTTGVWYDAAYANDLADPKSCAAGARAKGAEYDYSEAIDVDDKALATTIDPAKLAVDPLKGCAPVYPHSLMRVNNVFEVLEAAGLGTAWADKHPAYDLLQGPSGKGVDDLYTPEINADGITDSVEKTVAYDADKVKAVVNEINGFDHTGANKAGVPAILGLNFQAISVAQKLEGNGYLDAKGEPSRGLAMALDATDAALGEINAALTSAALDSKTLFIVTAKHGQSPIDIGKRRIVDGKSIKKIIEADLPGIVASVTTDDVALIWLKDKSKTAAVVAVLEGKRADLAIATILSGAVLAKQFADPATDPRAPDIIVQPTAGVIYTKPTASKIAEHGGGTDDDRHVALLVSHPGMKRAIIDQPVTTKQVAPTILMALGLDPTKLDAVRIEKTEALPSSAESLFMK